MLNGAKKTTFDIARISIQEVTFQISNSDNFTSSNSLLHNFRHNVDVFDIFSTSLFYQHPILALPLHSSHTHARNSFQKKRFFYAPPSFFPPPLQATKTTYTIFSFPNEILHKLTSCHFILQNKTLNDLYPKILLFSPPRAKLYNSSENSNSNTWPFLSSIFVKKPVLTKLIFNKQHSFFSLKLSNFTFQISLLKNKQEMMSTNERRRETT